MGVSHNFRWGEISNSCFLGYQKGRVNSNNTWFYKEIGESSKKGN